MTRISRLAVALAMIIGLSGMADVGIADSARGSAARAAFPVPSVVRLGGADRIATAIAVSHSAFLRSGRAPAVVLASAKNFPDALVGGPLAVHVGGPLLLTGADALDPRVLTEIQRVAKPGATIYILGGTAVMSSTIEGALAVAGYGSQRVAGADRFATAVAVADLLGDPATVLEASGLDFADALSAGPAASSIGAAILLTNGTKQSGPTSAYLASHGVSVRYAIGGAAAAADPTATAIVGSDRYATSVLVAHRFFASATTFGIASGTNFPDGLSAGAYLAAHGEPLLLAAGSNALPQPALADLLTTAFQGSFDVWLFGGTAAISSEVETILNGLVRVHDAAASMTATPPTDGRYGVASEDTKDPGSGPLAAPVTGNETVVVDGDTGGVTIYRPTGPGQRLPTVVPTRTALDALPTTDLAALKNAVNAMFAAGDAAAGVTGDADSLFAYNAGAVAVSPLASRSLELALCVALAQMGAIDVVADVGHPEAVVANAHDARGRPGIDITVRPDVTFHSNTMRGTPGFDFIFDAGSAALLEASTLDEDVLHGTLTSKDDATVTRRTIVWSDMSPADPAEYLHP